MDDERERAIVARAAEYDYFILDGAAVAPEGRLEELDRLLAADALLLLAELQAARAVLAAARTLVGIMADSAKWWGPDADALAEAVAAHDALLATPPAAGEGEGA
jgi:hypothetical protein